MKLQLKQFAESATDLRHNVFAVARLRLTALYVLILAVIICGFSLFLYLGTLHNLQDASQDDFKGIAAQKHFIHETIEPFRDTLILSDIIILFAAGGLSYWLAGRTLRPVQNSLEAQRLFAAQASHELRTPLTIMRNDIEVLLRNMHPSGEETRAVLQSNLEEIQNLSHLVKGLLVLARSENTSLEASSVEVSELITSALHKTRLLAKGIKITSSVEKGIIITGDPIALEQILINLIENSIKYSRQGGVVQIEAHTSGSYVKLDIQDQGTGIATDDLPHIFTPFFKGKGSNQEGVGLGLAIVKEIVDQHRGTIHVQSAASGTTVTVLLPK